MPGVVLQAVTQAADWLQFAQLLRDYAAHDLDQPHLSTIWQDLANLPARYAPPQGGAWLVRNAATQEPVGCGAWAATRLPGTCEIKRLYVRPAQRGQGHGKRIIRQLLGHAAQAGYTHAALSTWRSNEKGLALYADLGFAPVPPFKEHPNPDLLFLGLALPSP